MTTVAKKIFSESEIVFLSEKLKSNPSSPLFARLSDGLLQLEKVDEALALCESGIKKYPDYVSAYVILGKIHLKKGNYSLAKKSFLTAIQKCPTNQVAARFIKNIPTEEIIPEVVQSFPTFEEYSNQHQVQFPESEMISLDEYLSINKSGSEKNQAEQIDEIAQLLSQAEKIVPNENGGNTSLPDVDSFEPTIVTPTLAEIYANQEQFADAIGLYKTLIERRPLEKEEFEKRISELKNLSFEIAKLKKEGK